MPIVGDAGDFRRGIDLSVLPVGPQPSGVVMAENAELYDDGSIGPMAGRRILNPLSRLDDTNNSPLPIDAGFTYKDGSTEEVIVAADKLYKFDTDTFTFTALSGAANSLTSGTPGVFFQFQNYLLYGNGTDRVKVYDGSTVTNLQWPEAAGQAFKFNIFAEFNNRLYMAEGDAGSTWTARSRVYYSDAGAHDTSNATTATTWHQNQFRTVGAASKYAVTGLGNAGSGRLVMFKRNMAELLTGAGEASWVEHRLFDTIGCLDHKTIQSVHGYLVWYDEDGWRAFDGYTAPIISGPIQSIQGNLERSRVAHMQSIRFRSPWTGVEQYLCAVTEQSGGTQNDAILVASFFPDGAIGWGKITGIEPRALWNALRSDGFESWMSATSDGYIRRHDLQPDEQQDEAVMVFTTHPMLGDDPTRKKKFDEMVLLSRTDFPVSVTLNFFTGGGKQERTITRNLDTNTPVPLAYAFDKVADRPSYIDPAFWQYQRVPVGFEDIAAQVQVVYQGANSQFKILRLLLEGSVTGKR